MHTFPSVEADLHHRDISAFLKNQTTIVFYRITQGTAPASRLAKHTSYKKRKEVSQSVHSPVKSQCSANQSLSPHGAKSSKSVPGSINHYLGLNYLDFSTIFLLGF
jgi:phosphorylcholine metabolism protein LicD